jgi:hypothetical protein
MVFEAPRGIAFTKQSGPSLRYAPAPSPFALDLGFSVL